VARGRREPPEPLTPEEEAALKQVGAEHLIDLYAVLTGTGEHAEHERSQVGRCVYCSCGLRVQGRMEARRG
jgi:hypothetical protein